MEKHTCITEAQYNMELAKIESIIACNSISVFDFEMGRRYFPDSRVPNSFSLIYTPTLIMSYRREDFNIFEDYCKLYKAAEARNFKLI